MYKEEIARSDIKAYYKNNVNLGNSLIINKDSMDIDVDLTPAIHLLNKVYNSVN